MKNALHKAQDREMFNQRYSFEAILTVIFYTKLNAIRVSLYFALTHKLESWTLTFWLGTPTFDQLSLKLHRGALTSSENFES